MCVLLQSVDKSVQTVQAACWICIVVQYTHNSVGPVQTGTEVCELVVSVAKKGCFADGGHRCSLLGEARAWSDHCCWMRLRLGLSLSDKAGTGSPAIGRPLSVLEVSAGNFVEAWHVCCCSTFNRGANLNKFMVKLLCYENLTEWIKVGNIRVAQSWCHRCCPHPHLCLPIGEVQLECKYSVQQTFE